MKTRGKLHLFVTSFVLLCAAALTVKGIFFTEHTRLLLSDTGAVPVMYSGVIAFAIPLILGITSLLPVVVVFGMYIALMGALYQGLHFDCGCYLPGSVQSEVYSTLQLQFFIMLLVLLLSASLFYFNSLARTHALKSSV